MLELEGKPYTRYTFMNRYMYIEYWGRGQQKQYAARYWQWNTDHWFGATPIERCCRNSYLHTWGLQTTYNEGSYAIWNIRPKIILNSNLVKSRYSITPVYVIQSFWNFSQSTAVILLFSVQNFKTIVQLWNKLWANETSQDLSLRCVSDGYHILHKAPGSNLSLE